MSSNLWDGGIHRFRQGDVQLGVVLAVQAQGTRSVLHFGVAAQVVLDLGVVGQAPGGVVGQVDHHADVVADGSVVALDVDLGIAVAAEQAIGGQGVLQLAVDAVEGRTEADGNLVVDLPGDGRLHGDHLNLAIGAVGAAHEAVFVIVDDAVGHVDAQAESEIFVDRRGEVAERYGGQRYRVALVAALGGAVGLADVVLGLDDGQTAADFGAFQLGQAGRVAVDGAGIERGRGAAGVGGAGAAGALFVDGDAVGEGVGGDSANGQCERGFKPYCFHCWSNSCV